MFVACCKYSISEFAARSTIVPFLILDFWVVVVNEGRFLTWFFSPCLSFGEEDVHATEQRRADQERSAERDI